MIEIEDLEHAIGQPRFLCRPADPLRDQRGLLRVLEDDRVAGNQCRHQCVDGGQPRVVPRRDHEHDTERLAPNVAGEPVARLQPDVGQRFGCQVDHRPSAQKPASHLASAVAERPSHLHGELLGYGVGVMHGELHEATNHRAALVEVDLPPRVEGFVGRRQRSFDFLRPIERPLEHDAPIYRGNRLEAASHGR
jgi:hypothetical protein